MCHSELLSPIQNIKSWMYVMPSIEKKLNKWCKEKCFFHSISLWHPHFFLCPFSRHVVAVHYAAAVLVTVNSEISPNSIKRHICDAKNLRLGHDLPSSVDERMILLFREGFIFTKLRICEVSRK